MLFTSEVLVETTHTEDNKKEQILKIAHGIITRASVLFPSGCNGLVHCIVRHHEHQIFPSTEDMSITGNRTPIEWDDYYESYQPPYELKIEAWGVSCTNNHIVTVKIAVLPRKAIVALAVVDSIKDIFGTIGELIGGLFGRPVSIEKGEEVTE